MILGEYPALPNDYEIIKTPRELRWHFDFHNTSYDGRYSTIKDISRDDLLLRVIFEMAKAYDIARSEDVNNAIMNTAGGRR